MPVIPTYTLAPNKCTTRDENARKGKTKNAQNTNSQQLNQNMSATETSKTSQNKPKL